MDSSSTDLSSKSANHKVRKLLGRAYLRENRIREALEVYAGILKDYPNDIDVLYIVGNLYRLSGSPAAAERLYRRVLQLNPGDRLAEAQVTGDQAETPAAWDVDDELSAESIDCLAGRLQQGNTPSMVDEIRSAAEERSVENNGQQPEDGQQLMPALIELNIRQARAAGFPDLAEALQSLQINLARQADDHWADDLLSEDGSPEEKGPEAA